MRRAALSAARVALLAGPTVLAFVSGGYFSEARNWAGLGAWILVAIGLLLRPSSLPRDRGAWLAPGALGLLAAWTLLSTLWAPIAGNAYGAGQIAFLYLGVVVAAITLLSSRSAQRLVDPMLAAGVVIVIGYGLSERFLPGLLQFSRSVSAEGRLEQPLTYWNAMGEVAAIGLVLCTRVAGDVTRGAWMRTAAAGCAALLGMGLYVTFSRGALFACAAGLITLVIAARTREQLRATIVCLGAGALAALASARFAGVASLRGGLATRERQGAIVLGLLVIVVLLAAGAQWLTVRRERPTPLNLPARAPLLAAGVICVALGLAIAVGAKESSGGSARLSGGATRLVTLESNRYDYWGVALRAFALEPLHGVGAGGWSVYWLRWRSVDEFAQDAHSLPLQVLAELGVVGLALLAAFLGGLTLAAVRGLRMTPLAVGPVAGLVAYFAHSPLDWDWQMPAVTLIAMVLAGAVIAIGRAGELPLSAPTGGRAVTSAPVQVR